MKEFLSYKTMVTPGIVKVLSYIGMVVALIAGLLTMAADPLTGIATAILGPIAVRIYAEVMLIMFEIHGELKKLNDK
tara:strand:- start:166 stop:396 length:231 start_codon:yes stop_codon:yes gene_type:complete